ncbi:hypothetical protein NLJ89_g10524 [Agrocybe chaxingu]|uniref:Integrase catalytic domain-containing protein n=1 Tax=Agrocybe chaxingu TaxID=84603 RepID=A0A9W8MSJ4_9AGAR|nr:hypothetical protein NLJ89_g10524 [Agrocybe chaxingu]
MSTSKSNDDLKIPKLDVAGSNWVIYKDRFLWAIATKDLVEHVDGTATAPGPCPVQRPPVEAAAEGEIEDLEAAAVAAVKAELTKEEKVEIEQWKRETKEWRLGEAVVKQQIAATIPDSLFLKIRTKGTAFDIWKALAAEFQDRPRMVAIDLRQRLQAERCGEKGDLRAHFAKLRTMYKDLASLGRPVNDEDYYNFVLASLPLSYDPYVSSLNATASMLGKPITTDDLIQKVTEEYDHRTSKAKMSARKEENVAFYANENGGKKGESSSGGKKIVRCNNCKRRGHTKPDCWAKGGGKEGQGPKAKEKAKTEGKGKERESVSAASAKAKDDSDDAAWMAMSAFVQDEGDEASSTTHPSPSPVLLENLFPITEKPRIVTEHFTALYPGSSHLPNKAYELVYDPVADAGLFPELELAAANEAAAAPDDATDYADMPGLGDLTDSEYDSSELGDPFGSDWESDSDDDVSISGLEGTSDNEECGERDDLPVDLIWLDDEAYTTTFDAAELTNGRLGNSLIDVELYDSGASRHMSGYHHRFINLIDIEPKSITAADKRTFSAIGKGDMYIEVPNGETTSRVLLRDVLYAPSMGVTLISISRICLAGSSVLFSGDICRIYNSERVSIGKITVQKGLYRTYSARPEPAAYAGRVKEILTIDELHRIEIDEESQPTFCASCEWGKGHRKAIQKVREEERAAAVGNEVHSDLWGPAPVESINRKQYFVSFTDDHSRFTKIYLVRTKDETFESYRSYEAWLKTQHNVCVKTLHSDRGGEYLSSEFSEHLQKAGTTRRLTVHDTPEYNGVSERLNRTLLEKVHFYKLGTYIKHCTLPV